MCNSKVCFCFRSFGKTTENDVQALFSRFAEEETSKLQNNWVYRKDGEGKHTKHAEGNS